MNHKYTKHHVSLTLVVLSTVLAMGCSSDPANKKVEDEGDTTNSDLDSDADTDTDTDTDTDSDTDIPVDTEADASTAIPYDFEGTWAHVYYTEGGVDIWLGGIVPVPLNSRGVLYALVTAKESDETEGAYTATFEYCGVDFAYKNEGLMAGGLVIPQENVESTRIETKPFDMSEDGQLHQYEFVDLIGMDPDQFIDRKTDPLPAYKSMFSDPRVLDPEEDGHPGLTISWTIDLPTLGGSLSGEIYGAMRVISALDGQFVTNDQILGMLTFDLEIVVLGFGSTGGLDEVIYDNPEPTFPDPTRQRFEMVRMDETTACQDIMDHTDTIFEIQLDNQ